MSSLKQSVRESEVQREKAELKLAEAIARDHQNQVGLYQTYELRKLIHKLHLY